LSEKLQDQGIRVNLDLRNEKIGFKIREHTLNKIPFLLVIGDKEVENQTVAIRTRTGEDLGVMKLEELDALFQNEMAKKGRITAE